MHEPNCETERMVSHQAGTGKCYGCPSERRCGKFVVNHEEKMVR